MHQNIGRAREGTTWRGPPRQRRCPPLATNWLGWPGYAGATAVTGVEYPQQALLY